MNKEMSAPLVYAWLEKTKTCKGRKKKESYNKGGEGLNIGRDVGSEEEKSKIPKSQQLKTW